MLTTTDDVTDNTTLRARKTAVLRAWARQMPLGTTMVGPLGDVLDQLVGVIVGQEAASESLSDAIGVHVERRFRDGFTIEAVLQEYALLRQCIHSELRNRRFDHVVDTAISCAAKQYMALREELRERLVGVLAHDLRSPLACVTMANEMLMTEQRTPQERQLLEMVLESADRMRRLVNEVLGWAKGTIAVFPAAKRKQDLAALLHEIVRELRLVHGQDSVSLEVDGDLHANVDSDRVHQAMTNLVRNAIEHGMGNAQVRAFEVDAGRTIVLIIRNRGALRSPVGSAVGDPFKRRKRSSNARGLGLYIVDQIMRAHDASLDMATNLDETTVTIRLPTGREAG